MADATTLSNLNGLAKDVYSDKGIKDLLPSFTIVLKNTKFVNASEKSGSYFHQPVILQGEQGYTYMAANESPELNVAISMQMGDARVLGSQGALLARMTTDTAKRATSSGPSAFESATKLQMANTLESHTKRVEMGLLYGGTNNGIVDASTNEDSTHTTLAFASGQWSGQWAGMTNAKISAFKSTDGTILNANAPLVITAVDSVNKTVTVSGNSTDISDLDTWVNTGSQTAEINFYGARLTGNVYKEFAGIDRILTNTGTLFDIDAATYDLWKSNTYAAGGAFTQAKLNKAIALAVNQGLAEDISLLVSPATWATLNNDQAALRMYDDSYSDGEFVNGAKKLRYASQNGSVDVYSHPFVKESEGFLVPFDECVRPGASEVTFNIPGQPNGQIFTQLPNYIDFFYKSYSNLSLLINAPAHCVKITGITNA